MSFIPKFKKNLGLNCPNRSSELRITHRYDAEVDYCPTRKGVWLDRGEIDKIANTQNDDDYYRRSYGSRRRRSGFLEDLF